MSSLFGFSSDAATSTKILEDLEELNITLGPVVSAAGTRLPIIPRVDLSFDKLLGKGTTFVVNREVLKPSNGSSDPYYVAVKHVVPAMDAEDRERRNTSVARELRLCTYPALGNVQEILQVLGYGWNTNLLLRSPFIVVPYSEHGTLSYYLRRKDIRESITTSERRDLALDVARGLEALHGCKIIHGDLKPDNVLIFTILGSENSRHRTMAKLADFGACIFEEDESTKHVYGGTPLYNPPEQEGRGSFKASNYRNYKDYYAADVWSLGLTICEIIIRGRRYIQKSWLDKEQSPLEFLEHKASLGWDSLQWDLRGLCSHFIEEVDPVRYPVLQTLRVTLRDDPSKRASVSDVVQLLSQGATDHKPVSDFPSIRSAPPNQMMAGAVGITIDLNQLPSRQRAAATKSAHKPQEEDPVEAAHPLEVAGPTEAAGPYEETGLEQVDIKVASQAAAQWRSDAAKVFDHITSFGTPWVVQQSFFMELQDQTRLDESTRNTSKEGYYDNCLRLALAYWVGFGTRPDKERSLEYFDKSVRGNEIAKALWHRIAVSLQLEMAVIKNSHQTLDWRVKKFERAEKATNYFTNRVRCFQGRSAPLVPTMLDDTGLDHSTLLLFACQDGNFQQAMDLCHRCQIFVPVPGEPTPLHWLINFDERRAEDLGNALVLGTGDQPGPCANSLNTCLDFSIIFPEHCLELGGSPLHWAVRTRNYSLVQLLIKFGSDVNLSWKSVARTSADVDSAEESPLEIAVRYHLPEIAQLLLDSGAHPSQPRPVFYDIGGGCLPFARHLIHGAGYRQALRDTIQVLTAQGLDPWVEDERGNTPLTVALRDPDCEDYIAQELLATMSPASPPLSHLEITTAAIGFLSRRHSVSCLRLVAPLCGENINVLDSSGRNALHYAAIADSAEGVDILRQIGECDFNLLTSDGDHALHLAARFGSIEALPLLLDKGVDINISTQPQLSPKGRTPETALMIAATRQKKETVDFLLDHGANPVFDLPSAVYPTVLLAACTGPRRGESILPYLLQKHASLCESSLLNAFGTTGWTALHQAACFGDVESVGALLEKGADRHIKDVIGRTPLDIVNELLEQIRSDDRVISTHEFIFKRGKQAVADLEAALEVVQRSLRDE